LVGLAMTIYGRMKAEKRISGIFRK
jgi:hypothetical protein